MQLGSLPDNKLMSLMLQGYNPFQPDVGIFCGGYQGPLYPNPTTLIYPGFEPLDYREPRASRYQMDASYSGLGMGNPGINPRNPGHILGIFDTFSRMSYGIGLLIDVFAGTDGTPSTINPVVDVIIPMYGDDEDVLMSDIYPSLSEVPTDWINGFTVAYNGKVSPDPRPLAQFPILGHGHSPTTSPIDIDAFERLFGKKTSLAYFGMPEYFQSLIETLSTTANEYLSTKVEHFFTLEDPSFFNRYGHQNSPKFFDSLPAPDFNERSSQGTSYLQCVVHNPSRALETLTGSTNFHEGRDIRNEYRSLTELNSVINIVPVQMVGATFWEDVKGYRTVDGAVEVDDQTGRTFRVASYMIVDLVLNISDIFHHPATITIDGEATIDNLLGDHAIELYYYSEIRREFTGFSTIEGDSIQKIYPPRQYSKKNIDIRISETNQFAWDKGWLGQPLVQDLEFVEQTESLMVEDGGVIIRGKPAGESWGPWVGHLIYMDQSSLVQPFNKTFTLGAGCTSIRMRVFLRNTHRVTQDSFTNLYAPPPLSHTHRVGALPPTSHTHYTPGITSNGWNSENIEFFDAEFGYNPDQDPNTQMRSEGLVLSPEAMPGNVADVNLSLSFTVTGDNMEPIEVELSV